MNKILLKRMQDLAGIKKTIIKEEYENWEPKDERLRDLINKHNSIYKYLENNISDIEWDDRKFKRAWILARDFYTSIKNIWKNFIPANAPEIRVELWGIEKQIDPNIKAIQVLNKSKHALERAREDRDIVYLDNAYSFAHGVLKIIKGLQGVKHATTND